MQSLLWKKKKGLLRKMFGLKSTLFLLRILTISNIWKAHKELLSELDWTNLTAIYDTNDDLISIQDLLTKVSFNVDLRKLPAPQQYPWVTHLSLLYKSYSVILNNQITMWSGYHLLPPVDTLWFDFYQVSVRYSQIIVALIN